MASSSLITRRGRGQRPMLRSGGVYNLGGEMWTGAGQDKVSLSEIHAKPYLYSTWTFACARNIAQNLCRLTPELYERKNKNRSTDEHAVLDRFERPNPTMTSTTFRQAIILSLLLKTARGGGQCFIVPWNTKRDEPTDLRSGEIPDQLIPFNDEYFTPLKKETAPGSGRFAINGWRFEVKGQQKSRIDFLPNQIIRIYLYNPYDVLKGAAPYVSAQIAVDQDAKSDVYNSRMFENDGRVAGVLSTEQTNMTDDIADIYMQRWMENYGGVGNVGKIAILGNGLKYQQFGLTLADMQYVEQKRWNKDQVLSSFGLNKIAIGDYEKINYATIREGRKILWHDTYIPLDRMIWESINSQWISYIENGKFRGRSDYSDIESIQGDHKAQSEAGKNYVQGMSFPPALAARIIGINLKDEDLTMWPHLNEPPTTGGGKDADGDGEIGEAIHISTPIAKNAKQEEVYRWIDDYVTRVLEPGEEALFVDLRRFFYAQRNAMQDKVDAWAKTQKSVEVVKSEYVNPAIFILSTIDETKKLAKLLLPNFFEQLKRDEAKLKEELGTLIDWNATNEGAAKLVAKREKELRGINNLTFKKVEKQVSENIRKGIEENWTSGQLVKEIKSTLSSVVGTRVNQARTIARTELGIVSSEARYEAFKKEGVEYHKWLTHQDEAVRMTHRNLNGKVARIGKSFPGSKMHFPRDTRGGAGEVINCRCVAVAEFPDE